MGRVAGFLNARVKGRIATRQRIDCQGTGHNRGIEESLAFEQAVQRECQTQLSAIDEREAFFRLELKWFETRGLADCFAFNSLAVYECLTFADQTERYMSERR